MTYRSLQTLEKHELWRKAEALERKAAEIFDRLPEDQRSLLKWKFYSRAFELTSDIAEACGTFIPKDKEYSLSMARRDLFSVKNAYLYLVREGFIEIDPQFVVDCDKIDDEIKTAVEAAWKNIDKIEKSEKSMDGEHA